MSITKVFDSLMGIEIRVRPNRMILRPENGLRRDSQQVRKKCIHVKRL
jgi:hypothetical protein